MNKVRVFLAALALVLPDEWRLDPSEASRVAERDHGPGDFGLF